MNTTYKMEDQSKLRNKYQQKDGAEAQLSLFGKKKREMSDAERVLSLQCKLYQKAKQEKGYATITARAKGGVGYMDKMPLRY
jgi:hypothetical protein